MNILKRPGAEVGMEEERDGLRALQAYLHEASIMIWNNSITGMFLARENDQKYKPPSQPSAVCSQTRGPACNVSPRQDEAV